MVINNLCSVQSQKYMKTNQKKKKESVEKLSSGYKINKAADDAAGLSISEDMRRQVRGLERASLNSQEGISAMQIAEGAMAEAQGMLHRGLELCIQSANGTLSDSDRASLQDEIEQIKTEIDATAERAYFSEIELLKGRGEESLKVIFRDGQNQDFALDEDILEEETDPEDGKDKVKEMIEDPYETVLGESLLKRPRQGGGRSVAVQAGSETGEMAGFVLPYLSCSRIGIEDVQIGTAEGAVEGIDCFKRASAYVSAERSRCGAYQNRMEHNIANVENTSENVTASESRIRDTNMIKEQMKFSKENVLAQASQAILAQANQNYEGVVNLLTF